MATFGTPRHFRIWPVVEMFTAGSAISDYGNQLQFQRLFFALRAQKRGAERRIKVGGIICSILVSKFHRGVVDIVVAHTIIECSHLGGSRTTRRLVIARRFVIVVELLAVDKFALVVRKYSKHVDKCVIVVPKNRKPLFVVMVA